MTPGQYYIGLSRVFTSESAHATRSLAVRAATAGQQQTWLLARHGRNDCYGEGC